MSDTGDSNNKRDRRICDRCGFVVYKQHNDRLRDTILMLLIFIAMLPITYAVIAVILIGLSFMLFSLKKDIVKSINFYFAIFLSFLIPGMGIAYIGRSLKGFGWYFMQLLFVVIAILISKAMNIEDKYLGLIIMLPFFVQLYITGIEYKKKYGDIRLTHSR